MNPSTLLTLTAAILGTSIVVVLAYIQLPATPRRVERIARVWVSPAMLVTYILVVLAAFLAAVGV